MVARYRIESLIGAGQSSFVFCGVDLDRERSVAIKIFQVPLDELSSRRLLNVARAASRLQHPNIVTLLDFGIEEVTRRPFLVMERTNGKTLADLMLRVVPLPASRGVRILRQLASALRCAHDGGLAHRHVNASNVMVGRLDLVRLGGFGALPYRDLARGSSSRIPADEPGLASDIHAFGCIGHEVLAGAHTIRPELQDLLGRCVDADPDLRPSALELEATLRALESA